MQPSARAAAPAASSSRVGQQISAAQGGRTGTGSPTKLTSEVLGDAARAIEADTPWYEKLGLRCGDAAENGGDVTVEAVLATNVLSGLIDAANETLLAPVFVLLKGLLGAVQGAAAAREDIIELAQYCVGISRCLLEASKVQHMPSTIMVTLGEFKAEMESVERFVQIYGTRKGGWIRRTALNSRDRNTIAGHKQKLKDLLDAVLAGLAAQTYQVVNEVKTMMAERDPPSLPDLAEVPREAPLLPSTYVERTALEERVVQDLICPRRSPSATHCVVGMGGGGKTLLASSVVRDDRMRAAFKDGMFWVPVGKEGKDVALLLEYLAVELTRRPTNTPHSCPNRFASAEEAARHLSAVREKNGLRCLVVLDNVWSVEVVNAFARTGFHVLVTTRRRTIVSPAHAGLFTEVGDISEADALEVLRKASRAAGRLPADAAQVVDDCGFLPLALAMVGNLARERPLDPDSWRTLHDKLRGKSAKFRQLENGKLFSTIETSLRGLPNAQQEQLQLMAVMASGVAATPEMLANLWDQHISDVTVGASVLVGHCLLQDILESYRLHDLVLEYLQLVMKMDDDHTLAGQASSRQARYLGRLDVFKGYYSRGKLVRTEGVYALTALWGSVKKLDGTIDVEACYLESVEGVTDVDLWLKVGMFLGLLGHYRGAEAILRETVKAVNDQPSKPSKVATALSQLANVLEEQGKHQQADALSARAIDIEQKILGPDHPALAQSLGNRANVLAKQGYYEAADLLYRRIIKLEEKALGADHPISSTSLLNHASIISSQGKDMEADLLYFRSLEIDKKHLGTDHPRVAIILGNRAIIQEKQGKYDEADVLHRRAIEIHEKALGPDHIILSMSLTNRAHVHSEQGKHESADLLHQRAIRIREKALGPDNLGLVFYLNNRAIALERQDAHMEADLLHLRAIEIQEKHLGPDHPDLVANLCKRAQLQATQGRYDEADSLFRRAMGIQEKTLDPDDPGLALNLADWATVLLNQGKHTEADLLYLRASGIMEKRLGPDDPRLCVCLGGRGRILEAQGNYDGADMLYRREIEIQEKALGNDHSNLAPILSNRACMLTQQQGKHMEADLLYLRAIEIQEKHLDLDHPSLAPNLYARATLLAAQGNRDAADSFYRRAIEIEEKALGNDHHNLALGLNNWACNFAEQGEHAEADLLYLRVIDIQEKQLGPHHPSLCVSIGNRATLLAQQGKFQEVDALCRRAIDIKVAALGPDHLSLAQNLHIRANALFEQGKIAEADPLYARAVEIQENHLGPDHPHLGQNLVQRAIILQAQGQHIEADILFRRSSALLECGLGPDDPTLGHALGKRAVTLVQLGKMEEAETLHAKAVEIIEKALGADDPKLGTIHHNWGLSLVSQGKLGDARRALDRALTIRGKALGDHHEDTINTAIDLKRLDESQPLNTVVKQEIFDVAFSRGKTRVVRGKETLEGRDQEAWETIGSKLRAGQRTSLLEK